MFKITLSPQFSNASLSIKKFGDTLTINGNQYDFSSLNDGDEIPAEAISDTNIIGSITKSDGVTNVTVLMPYNDPNAPESVTHPVPLLLDKDGEVTFND